uniref:Secreted protein n=1 Tax=Romanomermis culicivorax TaxID=13658 RepID=A0A915HY67_ROMCU
MCISYARHPHIPKLSLSRFVLVFVNCLHFGFVSAAISRTPADFPYGVVVRFFGHLRFPIFVIRIYLPKSTVCSTTTTVEADGSGPADDWDKGSMPALYRAYCKRFRLIRPRPMRRGDSPIRSYRCTCSCSPGDISGSNKTYLMNEYSFYSGENKLSCDKKPLYDDNERA